MSNGESQINLVEMIGTKQIEIDLLKRELQRLKEYIEALESQSKTKSPKDKKNG